MVRAAEVDRRQPAVGTTLAGRAPARAHWADEFTPHAARRHHRHRIGHGGCRCRPGHHFPRGGGGPGRARRRLWQRLRHRDRLLAILADGGVDSRSVRTSDLTLGPRIEYNNGRQQVLGYQAGQRLTVNRDGLHGIERLLTDVASLGGEGVRIDGVSLTPGHPEEAMKLARDAAFADATAKARATRGRWPGARWAAFSGSTRDPTAAAPDR